VIGDHRQDSGRQKARQTIHQRNHLRVWLTRYRYRGQAVLLGAISRDIGVFLTTKSPTITTHAIDPWTDEARNYLAQDLCLSGKVKSFGMVLAIPPATRATPYQNTLGSPYWTDGYRAVFFVDDGERSLNDVQFFARKHR